MYKTWPDQEGLVNACLPKVSVGRRNEPAYRQAGAKPDLQSLSAVANAN